MRRTILYYILIINIANITLCLYKMFESTVSVSYSILCLVSLLCIYCAFNILNSKHLKLSMLSLLVINCLQIPIISNNVIAYKFAIGPTLAFLFYRLGDLQMRLGFELFNKTILIHFLDAQDTNFVYGLNFIPIFLAMNLSYMRSKPAGI